MTSSRQEDCQSHLVYYYDQAAQSGSLDVAQVRLDAVAAIYAARNGLTQGHSLVTADPSQCASSQSQSTDVHHSQFLSTNLRSRTSRGRASLSQTDSEPETQENYDGEGWYTAKWRGICTCALEVVSPSRQYSPVATPPVHLSALPVDDVLHTVQVGACLLDWGEPSPPATALDLAEFEHRWNVTTSRAGPSTSVVAQMLLARRTGYQSLEAQRKGKHRLTAEESSSAVTSRLSPCAPVTEGFVEGAQTGHTASDQVIATLKKRRKTRQEVLEDQGPSKLLEILPLPFLRPPLAPHAVHYMPVANSKVPDYGVSTPSDLPNLITRQPYTRVYWLLPVSGAVTVTHFEGHPSSGVITSRRPLKSAKMPEIVWTPHRLKQFWTDILQGVLQRTGRYGPIGLAASGPKPDPFRSEALYDDAVVAGDHMRVYCDLEWALKVRKFLEFVRVYDGTPAEGTAGLRGERVMKNAKLVLVGDLGEPLMVA